MKNIIGIGGSIHDFSLCLIKDEEISTVEVERISKSRYAPSHKNEHLTAFEYIEKILDVNLSDAIVVGDDMISLNFFPDRIITNHHDMHAISSFYQSPFDECCILVVDGVGSSISLQEPEKRETISLYHAMNGRVQLIDRIYGEPTNIRIDGGPRIRTNSLGDWYRLFTQKLGFHYLQAGKTMGLYPYGDDRYHRNLENFIKFPKGRESYEIKYNNHEIFNIFHNEKKLSINESNHKNAASLASLAQYGIEKSLEFLLSISYNKINSKKICITGGVAQNSVAMGKILEISEYDELFVDHAPGDNGVSIGAAITGRNLIDRKKISHKISINPYTNVVKNENKNLIAINNGYLVNKYNPTDISKFLSDEKIIATHFNNSEFGARALGNRSILADPRNLNMRRRINEIKSREWFRPVAPCILKNYVSDFFITDLNCSMMQYVIKTKTDMVKLIPSAIHIDGSARLQVMSDESHPLYEILENFYSLTNVPILLNTSFNLGGNPIIQNFEDALDSFEKSSIDVLIFEDGYICK